MTYPAVLPVTVSRSKKGHPPEIGEALPYPLVYESLARKEDYITAPVQDIDRDLNQVLIKSYK